MRRIVTTVTIAIVLMLIVGIAVNAQAIRNTFDWVIANQLTVNNTSALTGDVSMGDDLTVTDLVLAADVTATDDAVTGDDLTVGDDAAIGSVLRLVAATSITVTQGATLSPTGSYQPITAAGNLSFGAITAGTAGDVLTVINASNTTITITDTSTLKLSGNLALGQYDSVMLLSDGTNWVQLATTNN